LLFLNAGLARIFKLCFESFLGSFASHFLDVVPEAYIGSHDCVVFYAGSHVFYVFYLSFWLARAAYGLHPHLGLDEFCGSHRFIVLEVHIGSHGLSIVLILLLWLAPGVLC